MKKILNIVTSLKGDASMSNKVSNAILEKLSAAHPGSSVHTRNLSENPFPYFEEVHMNAFYTPVERHTPDHKVALTHSDEAIKEMNDADIIVIGVPMYNLSIPSTLKSWIDHVVRRGHTFRFTEKGTAEGLMKNKKVYLAIASGGVYAEGNMKSYDFTESYLRTILGFIGLTDVTVFRVEGTVVPGVQDNAVPKALGLVNEHAF